MGRYGSMDYPTLTKRGFQVGLAMFLVGALGRMVAPMLFGTLPGWEQTLLFDLEVLGIVVGLLAPITFGIVMPLTE